jgi:hypothetical protein
MKLRSKLILYGDLKYWKDRIKMRLCQQLAI